MNFQAMMKQAQKMQKDMLKATEEINNTDFVGESELVTVTVKGDKTITKVDISKDFEMDDLEMLEDMFVIAVNDAMKKIDAMTEEKLGKYKNIPGLSGLF